MLRLNSLGDPKLVRLLNDGAVGVLPTDTIYGVVCAAHNKEAVARLYKLKSREHKPGTIIAANTDQLIALGVTRRYLSAVQQFWPNPISIEIPHDIAYLHQGTGRQAFRVVKDRAVEALLEETGPLLTSSANQPGEPPATTIAEAQACFDNQIDFYVDGGDLSDRLPSTIIRIVDDEIDVVRQGAIKINENGEIVS